MAVIEETLGVKAVEEIVAQIDYTNDTIEDLQELKSDIQDRIIGVTKLRMDEFIDSKVEEFESENLNVNITYSAVYGDTYGVSDIADWRIIEIFNDGVNSPTETLVYSFDDLEDQDLIDDSEEFEFGYKWITDPLIIGEDLNGSYGIDQQITSMQRGLIILLNNKAHVEDRNIFMNRSLAKE